MKFDWQERPKAFTGKISSTEDNFHPSEACSWLRIAFITIRKLPLEIHLEILKLEIRALATIGNNRLESSLA